MLAFLAGYDFYIFWPILHVIFTNETNAGNCTIEQIIAVNACSQLTLE